MTLRRGTSLIELLFAVSVAAVLLGAAFGAMIWARRAGEAGVASHVSAQMLARRSMEALTRELEESIEVVRPPPGATLNHLLVRDKLNRLLVIYPVETSGGLSLRVFRMDPTLPDAVPEDRVLVRLLERVAFTTLGPGMVQVHLTVRDQGHAYPVFTAIRCRNAPSEAEL